MREHSKFAGDDEAWPVRLELRLQRGAERLSTFLEGHR